MTTSTNDGAGSGDGRDDLDDELQLRSMRAVWLSMRDEDPPEGGLAALMAAARAKAEELRPKEPWWQRALAGLRRPPVLALATVVVLLGGVIVIGGRHDSLESTPMVASDEARRAEPASAGAGAADTADTAAGSAAAAAEPEPAAAAPGGAPAPMPAPAPAPAVVAEGAARTPDVAATPADSRPQRPAGKSDAMPRGAARDRYVDRGAEGEAVTGGGGGAASADGDADAAAVESKRDFARAPAAGPQGQRQAAPAAPAAPAPPPPPAATAPEQAAPPKGGRAPERKPLAIAADSGVAEPRPDAPGGPAAPGAGGTQIQGTGGASGPTLEQLAKQSQTAAARGDCVAVRAITGKMRQLDAAFHRAHVAGNASVRRCVQ